MLKPGMRNYFWWSPLSFGCTGKNMQYKTLSWVGNVKKLGLCFFEFNELTILTEEKEYHQQQPQPQWQMEEVGPAVPRVMGLPVQLLKMQFFYNFYENNWEKSFLLLIDKVKRITSQLLNKNSNAEEMAQIIKSLLSNTRTWVQSPGPTEYAWHVWPVLIIPSSGKQRLELSG